VEMSLRGAEATKQSSFLFCYFLDCFAWLALTANRGQRWR
jgi:hypothetical protein